MEIYLDCGNWYINGYVIIGDLNIGYDVYEENNMSKKVYNNESFEPCLTWCYNS